MAQPDPPRLIRLAEELREDGLPALSREALEEVLYARYPPVHEAKQPRYGALVATSGRFGVTAPATPEPPPALPGLEHIQAPLVAPFAILGVQDLSGYPLKLARQFANGTQNFLCRDDNGHYLWSTTSVTENSLSHLAKALGATIVQRLGGTERVRIYHEHGIATWNGAGWVPKPYASTYSSILENAIPSLDSTTDVMTASAILDLCVHTLAAANIGATIVWDRNVREAEFEEDSVEELRAIDSRHAFSVPRLSITDANNHPAVASLLAQHDRALILNDAGELTMMGVSLTPPPTVEVTTPGGTRHNSAIAFSEAERHTLVFVVSQDGPVSVFRRGICVASSTEGFHIVKAYGDCPDCAPMTSREGELLPGDPNCEECDGTGRAIDDIELLPISHDEYRQHGNDWSAFPSRSIDWGL